MAAEAQLVRDMFDRIAGRYDRANRIMSAGVDVLWRGKAIRALLDGLGPAPCALDLGAGTLDGAIAILRRRPGARVLAADFSRKMLEVGKGKPAADGYSNWTYLAWGKRPPEIGLGNLDALTASGRLMTPQGIPFKPFGPDRNIAFTSLWDNWPDRVALPVGTAAERVWLLVCGTTNCMQGGIESARFRFRYEDGEEETLGLVHPRNFWTLCPTCGVDYDAPDGAWPLPAEPPPQVQLGENCRAMVLSWTTRPGAALKEIELECLSEDVVVGWMGTTLEGASLPAATTTEETP